MTSARQSKADSAAAAYRSTIINSIIGAIVTLGMGWIGLQQRAVDLATARIEAAQEAQGKVLHTVRKSADGALTSSLLLTAQATKRTASISNDAQDIQIASDAEKAYQTQKELQKEAEHPH